MGRGTEVGRDQGRERDRQTEAERMRRRDGETVTRVQELCESRGGRPGLSIRMSLTVSVDVKLH